MLYNINAYFTVFYMFYVLFYIIVVMLPYMN